METNNPQNVPNSTLAPGPTKTVEPLDPSLTKSGQPSPSPEKPVSVPANVPANQPVPVVDPNPGQPTPLKTAPAPVPANPAPIKTPVASAPVQVAQPVAGYKFNEASFKSHLNGLKEEQMKYQGKHNHNPFLWIANNIRPLETRFDKGERTQELFNAATSLEATAPRINPDISDATADATPAIAVPTNPTQLPQGLKLPQK